MRHVFLGALLAASMGVTAAAQSVLQPASPQPGNLRAGLAVSYAYPVDVKTLSAARGALASGAEAGQPLAGLSYPDRGEGARALTSKKSQMVAARIGGYIRFDQPGEWLLRVYSNDGIDIKVGGVPVGHKDERTPCSLAGKTRVQVPRAGWYAVEAVFFQRMGTSCLEMEWVPPGGKRQPVPDSAFGY